MHLMSTQLTEALKEQRKGKFYAYRRPLLADSLTMEILNLLRYPPQSRSRDLLVLPMQFGRFYRGQSDRRVRAIIREPRQFSLSALQVDTLLLNARVAH